eukprot:1020098-Amphidinium_carterae.1
MGLQGSATFHHLQETRGEQCIFGHSHPVEILELSDDGLWAASVQGSPSQSQEECTPTRSPDFQNMKPEMIQDIQT